MLSEAFNQKQANMRNEITQKRATQSKRRQTQTEANNWSQMFVALEIQTEASKTSKDKQ